MGLRTSENVKSDTLVIGHETNDGVQYKGTMYLDPINVQPPQFFIYLHTISRRHFEQQNPIFGNIFIPAVPKGQRYLTFMKLGHPVQYPVVDPDRLNEPPQLKKEDARAVALTIVNPDYWGLDLTIQDKPLPAERILSTNRDLCRQGVFASRHDVPTEEELKTAEGRRDAYYRFLINEANTVERSEPQRLHEVLSQDHHLAAEHFALDLNWHKIPVAKVDCPNCGAKIKDGVAFHIENGIRCVLDWQRAYEAGAVRKEDVPDSKRWDTAPAKVEKGK